MDELTFIVGLLAGTLVTTLAMVVFIATMVLSSRQSRGSLRSLEQEVRLLRKQGEVTDSVPPTP